MRERFRLVSEQSAGREIREASGRAADTWAAHVRRRRDTAPSARPIPGSHKSPAMLTIIKVTSAHARKKLVRERESLTAEKENWKETEDVIILETRQAVCSWRWS